MKPSKPLFLLTILAATVLSPGLAWAQAAAGSLPAPAAQRGDDRPVTRTASLPAKGLFVGDQLSPSAKARLIDLLVDAIGLDVEVALVVPTGPWVIDGGGHTDRDLNDKRLAAVRGFLAERGVDPKRVFVESRIDAKVREPRLDLQLIGRPAKD